MVARHSDVFRDMFSIPQPPAGTYASDDEIEGCPIVHIPDESPEDLEVFLDVLYDGAPRCVCLSLG